MPPVEYFLLYLAMGAAAGVLAGLLGVGGGLIVVPALTFTLQAQGVAPGMSIRLALGTSLASIIFTSISSALAHDRRGAVAWRVVASFAPGVVGGTLAGSLLASRLSPVFLRLFFSAFLMLVCLQLFFGLKPGARRRLPGRVAQASAGSVIGAVSSLVGIGGGILTVPYLLWHDVEVRRAIGTSAAVGFPIAAAGAAGYLAGGLGAAGLPGSSLGYIYLPALAAVAAASTAAAPLGAALAHRLPAGVLRRVLSVALVAVAIRMAAGAL
ncbi:MAG: sulfite exporter TauE/SafE family protein [Gaiellales bacterium]|nr:MAG: sulfite exporter TauE/SafE family protein [Gaiellales bacterium]